MPWENVSESEIRELAQQFAQRFPHLNSKRHYKIVKAGYGNYIAKEHFREWYERTIPLLNPSMVATRSRIHGILGHDSFMVNEAGAKPIYQILQEAQ